MEHSSRNIHAAELGDQANQLLSAEAPPERLRVALKAWHTGQRLLVAYPDRTGSNFDVLTSEYLVSRVFGEFRPCIVTVDKVYASVPVYEERFDEDWQAHLKQTGFQPRFRFYVEDSLSGKGHTMYADRYDFTLTGDDRHSVAQAEMLLHIAEGAEFTSQPLPLH